MAVRREQYRRLQSRRNTTKRLYYIMVNPTNEQRSSTNEKAARISRPSPDHSPTSGADSTETRAYDNPDSDSRRKRRSYPTVISGRVQHATKDRVKAVARSRGISMCQLVREAVRDVLRTHKQSPDAV